MDNQNREKKDDIIAGRNPVTEALSSGRPIESILVSKNNHAGSIVAIISKAKST